MRVGPAVNQQHGLEPVAFNEDVDALDGERGTSHDIAQDCSAKRDVGRMRLTLRGVRGEYARLSSGKDLVDFAVSPRVRYGNIESRDWPRAFRTPICPNLILNPMGATALELSPHPDDLA